jgi:glycine betaine/choline ABC-type transport system substrate-binding protein
MNKMQEQLARDLIQNVTDAQTNAEVLAMLTDDKDFVLLGHLMEMLLVAKAKGDLPDFARALSQVAGQKHAAQHGGSAINAIVNDFDFNNIGN